MYLLDTNILSNLIRKTPNVALHDRMRASPPETLFTSCICVMELRQGAARRRDSGALWTRIQREILPRVSVLSLEEKEALIAGDVLAHLETAGMPIGIEDVLIGATALGLAMTVVTNNVAHFRRIPNLRVEDWLAG